MVCENRCQSSEGTFVQSNENIQESPDLNVNPQASQSSADIYAVTETISTVAWACFCTCSAVDWVICSSCGIHICHGIAIARKKQKRKMQHATWKMCILDRRRVEHLYWHDSLDMNWYQHKVVRTYHTDRCTEGVRRDVGAEFWLDNTRVQSMPSVCRLQGKQGEFALTYLIYCYVYIIIVIYCTWLVFCIYSFF